ncbi:MAG TPA: lipocalin-like domain-containing protein [Anaerolineae bacterium]|jgi:predicted secreted hydrolase
MKVILIIIALVLLSGLALVQYDRVTFQTHQISAEVESLAPKTYNEDQFLKVYGVTPLEFPQDHGAHPDYQIEWWYYTGNLADGAGGRYGFQFTVFRRGIVRGDPERESEWATHQLYFAHLTVTDVAGETFEFHERFSRASPGLAGTQGEPFYHVWIDDWYAKEIEPGKVQLKASAGSIGLDLMLEPDKPIALQGDRGYSAKSAEPGNASTYYSQTRMPTHGTITTARGTFEVSGNTWQDREWGSSVLPEGTVGWDWFSLQLADKREVMYFVIRTEAGDIYPGSSGLVVYPDGTTRYLVQDDVQFTVLDHWTSPASGATYPAGWRFTLPDEGIDLNIEPLLNDQELRVSSTYWEGAVRIEGSQTGYGYIELTGYANTMRGRM